MEAHISRFAVKGYALQERVLRARFDAFIAPVDFLLYIVYKVCILWLCQVRGSSHHGEKIKDGNFPACLFWRNRERRLATLNLIEREVAGIDCCLDDFCLMFGIVVPV